ncbi:MAG: Secretion system C-terminal sorting domain [Fluviicola sp.]|jgi:hypothetical protein|uniref:T9SS type A sorting domain-containing protein n=1 Tax=Fluviicola sp. TaxID=1917219 RepID=UPI00260DAC49|nr:T9SS type A sorting domain-containing protein [Fluviicola sp.]MDF3027796.1 Secretion system C-terminal sorting domain [Fluviicola sp.]
MKTLLFLFISCFSLKMSYAQPSNAQIYDFDIGDVFQVNSMGSYPGPPIPLIQTDTVIAKYYSNGMDTLYYVINRLDYVQGFMQTPSFYDYYIDTLVVTNLNAPAAHFTSTSCLPVTDTLLVSACGVTYERLHSNHDTSCFEPQIWYSDLYLGLGGPYYYRFDPTAPIQGGDWFSKTLIYYHSAQHGECGVFQSVASLDDLSLDFEVKVFPIPASKEIRIESAFPLTAYRIYSFNGAETMQKGMIGSDGSIDISSLHPGVYFLEMSSSDSMKTARFIKQD